MVLLFRENTLCTVYIGGGALPCSTHPGVCAAVCSAGTGTREEWWWSGTRPNRNTRHRREPVCSRREPSSDTTHTCAHIKEYSLANNYINTIFSASKMDQDMMHDNMSWTIWFIVRDITQTLPYSVPSAPFRAHSIALFSTVQYSTSWHGYPFESRTIRTRIQFLCIWVIK